MYDHSGSAPSLTMHAHALRTHRRTHSPHAPERIELLLRQRCYNRLPREAGELKHLAGEGQARGRDDGHHQHRCHTQRCHSGLAQARHGFSIFTFVANFTTQKAHESNRVWMATRPHSGLQKQVDLKAQGVGGNALPHDRLPTMIALTRF